MVSGAKTKVASLVLTVVVLTALCLPIDVKAVGLSRGCTLWQRMGYISLHGSILHALVNLWCLLSLCFNRNIPLWQFVTSYAIAVSYPTFLMGDGTTVGLSGMIFALLGMISLASSRWHVNVAFCMVIIGFGYLLPNIDASLHLYCYIAGLAVGAINKPVLWTR